MKDSVLLDTSFFIRLLNSEDPLHENAKGYFKYFLENDITLKISTITIAEYCVRGRLDELPLKNIQIIPFNLNHAQKTGEFAKIIFEAQGLIKEKISPRAIIPNDSKLFAQAELDQSVTHFVTSDTRSKKTINALKQKVNPMFEFIDINLSHNETFGILNFE
ncbi:MAG: type II toxin-antitoxin system VapC family toxin [Bacteroidia bacterium]